MDLIPISDDKQEVGARSLQLSPAAIQLASISTTPVERKVVSAEIRLDGKVEYDETKFAKIAAWVPGRIDRLFVDYTGVTVKKGDHLVKLYSPELVAAQQELVIGLKILKNSSPGIKESARSNVSATREKLRLWGLTDWQITRIERKGTITEQTTIYSPLSGIVIEKNGFEGMYVKTGSPIYTVADLSQVWVILDAYESDLMWLRYGQEVSFETRAYPGEVFTGTIAFIHPVLNAATRSVKVRVNVPNPDGKLKPEMFVSAQVYPKVAAGGRVMDPALSGKWICPMHPEIIRIKKGVCPLCKMELVTTESLGYVPTDIAGAAPLVIPASAPLITGKRAVVYVADPQKAGLFAGREIILGPRAGSYYIVKEGLQEGEQVVTNGNFKIDSAVQIMAKPSMMNPKGSPGSTGHTHGQPPAAAQEPLKKIDSPEVFKQQLEKTISAYFSIQQALSTDNKEQALTGAKQVLKALDSVDMSVLKGQAHMIWMQQLKNARTATEALAGAKDIAGMRVAFETLSDTLYAALQQFGTSGTLTIHRFHCPMTFNNRGAYWLQQSDKTENPYYGSKMFRCGTKTETLASGEPGKQKEYNHE
jgi:Cu(I)/Ag(I) efflux system membrane fusion protein